MTATTKRKIKYFLSPLLRIGLKNKTFSIISNNCWAGHYYDMFHLPYLTPTIGLFFPPKDYLKFISNLSFYCKQDLHQIFSKDAKCYDMLKRKQENGWIESVDKLIIGKLNDIEIVFLHYSNFNTAKEKWERRVKRINYSCLIFKFNDQNEMDERDYLKFQSLQLQNKIFFTSNPKYLNGSNTFFIKKYKNLGFALDDIHKNGFPFKKYVNSLVKK